MSQTSFEKTGREDDFVNGYYGGNNTETEEKEEEITEGEQDEIDEKIQNIIDKNNENTLFLYVLTPEERKDLESYLLYNKFNSYTYYNIVGKGYDTILNKRLDDVLRKVRKTDTNNILERLKPFDKYHYAVLKNMEKDDEAVADAVFDVGEPYENMDQLVLQNTEEGYKARTEAGNYFLGGVTTNIEGNEVGWIAEYLFATKIYPDKYNKGNELPLPTEKYIFRQSGYYGKWDFLDNTYSFEIKTQNMSKESPGPLYYCQTSKLENIPANVSKIALWWGKVPSFSKTIKDRTIKEWRYIEIDKNDLGPGKTYHFKNDGLYKNKEKIAYYAIQAGHQYAANNANQIVFDGDKYLQKYTL